MQVEKGKGNTSELSRDDPLKAWLDGKNVTEIDVIDDDQGTAQVHPELFCHTLLQECQKEGVRLLQGRVHLVMSKSEQGHFTVEIDNGQEIKADRLAFCTGPWTGKVLKDLFDVDIPIYELAGHSVVLKTSKPLPSLALFATVSDEKGKSTATPELFSRPDGTIYIAGENCECAKYRLEQSHDSFTTLLLLAGAPLPPGTAHVKKTRDSIQRLLSACKLVSPLLDLNDAEIVKEQLCYRPISRRGYPYLCKLSSNLFFTAGHGPWRISLEPGTGKVMSEVILDGHAISADISDLEGIGRSSEKGKYGILDIVEQRLGIIK